MSGYPERPSIRRTGAAPLSHHGRDDVSEAIHGPAVRASGHGELDRAGTRGGMGGGVGRAGLALRIERQRNPRLLGALTYAVPLLPALVLLLRERRNRFVRAHAAQSLVFFAVLALAQIAIFVLLVMVGGLTANVRTATVLAVVFALGWLALAALSFVAWTRLVGAALAGHVASLPLVTPLARLLLRSLDRVAAARGRGRNDRRSA